MLQIYEKLNDMFFKMITELQTLIGTLVLMFISLMVQNDENFNYKLV